MSLRHLKKSPSQVLPSKRKQEEGYKKVIIPPFLCTNSPDHPSCIHTDIFSPWVGLWSYLWRIALMKLIDFGITRTLWVVPFLRHYLKVHTLGIVVKFHWRISSEDPFLFFDLQLRTGISLLVRWDQVGNCELCGCHWGERHKTMCWCRSWAT